ncbi:class I glutamine amidotransferase-like protein [Aaosphaeria arxii CBS 175.79]|uniref:Class I glutamine amidotransferase-like protein n=1 Tax=Aaosphaeria arxii CBS 175.79 TaxID=1450172 RepID=A0A6A5XS27_9PLEO|nr:class I glutamine amidotransferase-like protein [Aaosphaeria arxii CBS 175.79]KAF2016135.1 class I glutamine amidotransferase-like protein [Aaosphaeria arxii CBS 175.79]
MSTSEKKTIRIGVLYEEVQMSDLVAADVLGCLSVKYAEVLESMMPSALGLLPLYTPMEFLYISSSLVDDSYVTPDMHVKATHTYANAPRDLDIILLGGPDPTKVKEESLQFLREASKQTKVILSTCSGGMWLAKSGILDGKKATTNRMGLPLAKQFFPNVDWQDQRWVIEKGHFDGAEIWTGGGAGCGIDMAVEYVKRNFDRKIVEFGCAGLDFSTKDKSQFYDGPAPSFAELL